MEAQQNPAQLIQYVEEWLRRMQEISGVSSFDDGCREDSRESGISVSKHIQSGLTGERIPCLTIIPLAKNVSAERIIKAISVNIYHRALLRHFGRRTRPRPVLPHDG